MIDTHRRRFESVSHRALLVSVGFCEWMWWDIQRGFRNGASGKNRPLTRRGIFERRCCFPSTESPLKHQIRITSSRSSSRTSAGFLFPGDRIPVQYLWFVSSGWPRLKGPNAWTTLLQIWTSRTVTLGGSDCVKLIWSTSWSSWSIVLNRLCSQSRSISLDLTERKFPSCWKQWQRSPIQWLLSHAYLECW